MEECTKKVDLLHPLVAPLVKSEIKLPMGMKDCQAVRCEEKLYVGGGTTQSDSATIIHVYSLDNNEWGSINTPVSHFALAVYHWQRRRRIVLVGGKECSCEDSLHTNKVWVMTESDEHWNADIIPPMSLQRCGAVAVSTDSVLIVTGGECVTELSTFELYVEMYDGVQWWNIRGPRDLVSNDVKMAIHEGDCYLMGGRRGISVFSASLVSLSKVGGDHEEDLSLWRQIPDIPPEVAWGCPAIFGSRLVVQNGGFLFAYCPNSRVWVLVLKTPNENAYSTCVIGSNKELMIVGGEYFETKVLSKQIIQVSINYPVYNPNEKFSFESLFLLQSEIGIPLLSELEKRRRDFLRLIRVKQTAALNDALKRWITDGVPSHIQPTWKNLRLLLCLLDLDELECKVGGVLNDTQLCDDGANAPHEYQYCAMIFLIHQKTGTYEIHFVIARDIKDHVPVTIKDFKRKGAHSGPHQLIQFEENSILLDVNEFNEQKNGWKLTPQSHPEITKQQVDTFEPGKSLPSCQLLARLLLNHQMEDVPEVDYQIHLCGAKAPHNYFTINLPITDHEYYMLPRKRRLSRSSEIEQSSAKRSCVDESTQTSIIGAPSLKDLLKEFYTNAKFDMWENIGIMLEINDGELSRIKTDHGDSRTCLREMFRVWLNKEPQPSWCAIVEAFEIVGNDQAFVQTLKSKYC